MNPRWNYKTTTVRAKGLWGTTVDMETLEQQLRELGVSGWELVALVPVVHGGGGLAVVLNRAR